MKKYLEVAKFTRAQGLKGELRAQYFCGCASEICEYKNLYLGAGKIPVNVQNCREIKNSAVIKLTGIDTVEDAQKLIGEFLFIDKDEINLPENTWFIQDIIGLRVIDVDSGKFYGRVENIFQNSPTDVYSVRTSENGLIMFPAIPEVLIETDIGNGFIKIRPLAGLLEVYDDNKT